MTLLIEPFQHGFMQQALIASVLIAITCASLGVHVVLRRMAFFGDAIAHATLPGLVAAYLLGLGLFVGALVAALATALGIGRLSRRALAEDTVIGVVFTGMFALGIAMMRSARTYRDLTHMLFGNVLGVGPAELGGLAAVCALVLLGLAFLHKELVLTGVDPRHARAIGLSPALVRDVLLVLLALAVVAGIQAAGVVLTSALLVTPAATALQLSRRLGRVYAIAFGVAAGSSVGGLYVSYYFAVPSGSAIVLCCTATFLLVHASIACRRWIHQPTLAGGRGAP